MLFRYCLSLPLDASLNKHFRKVAYLVGNLKSDESRPGWDCSSMRNGTLVWQRTHYYSYEWGIKSQLVNLFPKPVFFLSLAGVSTSSICDGGSVFLLSFSSHSLVSKLAVCLCFPVYAGKSYCLSAFYTF